jgi:hypothetical protein
LLCSRHIRPFEDAHKRAPKAHHQPASSSVIAPVAEGRAHHVAALEGVEGVGLAAQAAPHDGEGLVADLLRLVLDGLIDRRHMGPDLRDLGIHINFWGLGVHGVHPFL